MPSNPKVIIHNVPYEVCTSVQTGLPFVATRYMSRLIEGVLAAAQSRYPVTICHFMVMANHVHLIVVIQDPADLPRFMCYFKTELAHALNRLLGKTGQSFWVEGYDSVMILSPEKLLERLEYLYLNPVDAGLVRKTKDYPGLCTFPYLGEELVTKRCKKVSRDEFEELPEGCLTKEQRQAFASQLLDAAGIEHELRIEPWAWLKCFSACKDWSISETRTRFLKFLKENGEKYYKTIDTVIGAAALEAQDIRKPFKSKRNGRKMLCMSHCISQRRRVIGTLKTLIGCARQAYRRRASGDCNALPPPGFFLPGGVLLANLLPAILEL